MARQMKRARPTLAILGFAVICWGIFKVSYLGVASRVLGNAGGYEVVACETWHSFGSVVSNDGRGGFYRIYDPEGRKVFELFSDAFAFDIVITSAQEAEFQLNSGEIKVWTRPDQPQ